jgi:hypothetical protein
MGTRPPAFPVDETPLRDWVLKAYQDRRGLSEKSKRALDAVRQFLSGAPGGRTVVERYWFEEDPPASVASFVEDLDRAETGLARSTIEPLVAAVIAIEEKRSEELAPNISVYVSSLAGSLTVKTGLDETLACSVISATILGLSRLGRKPFEESLKSQKT